MIADGFRGNDLVVRHDGSLYVTNPSRDASEPSKVWYISPKGEKKVVDTGLKFANGVTLSPDQSLLYVADSRSHWVYSYQIQPDGSLAHKQKYYHLHVPDTADDSRRRRHARRPRRPALRGHADGHPGLRPGRPGQLHHPHAQRQGRRTSASAATDFDTLYATCGDKVYKRKVKVKGANAFQAPVKPARAAALRTGVSAWPSQHEAGARTVDRV